MEKQISIVVAASGEIRDIALSEGATALEVLNEVGLQGYQLSRKGGDVLAPGTDLYLEAMDKEKLYATPEDVSVGIRALKAYLCFWISLNGCSEYPTWKTIGRSPPSRGDIKKQEFALLALDR